MKFLLKFLTLVALAGIGIVAAPGANADSLNAVSEDAQLIADLRDAHTEQLREMANHDPAVLMAIFQQSFGEKATPAAVRWLVNRAREGRLPAAARVEFVEAGVLAQADAWAVYSRRDSGIILSADLRSQPDALRIAYAEEAGHHLDASLGTADTPGDEGAIFSRALAAGSPLAAEDLQALLEHDDAGIIHIGATSLAIEAGKSGAKPPPKGQKNPPKPPPKSFGDLWNDIKSVATTVGGALGTAANAVGNVAKTAGNAALNVVQAVYAPIHAAVIAPVVKLVDKYIVQPVIAPALKWLDEKVVGPVMKHVVGPVWDMTKKVASAVGDKLEEWKNSDNGFLKFVGGAGSLAVDLGKLAVQVVAVPFVAIGGGLAAAASGLKAAVVDGDLKTGVLKYIEGQYKASGVGQLAQYGGLYEKAKDRLDVAVPGLGSIGGAILESIPVVGDALSVASGAHKIETAILAGKFDEALAEAAFLGLDAAGKGTGKVAKGVNKHLKVAKLLDAGKITKIEAKTLLKTSDEVLEKIAKASKQDADVLKKLIKRADDEAAKLGINAGVTSDVALANRVVGKLEEAGQILKSRGFDTAAGLLDSEKVAKAFLTASKTFEATDLARKAAELAEGIEKAVEGKDEEEEEAKAKAPAGPIIAGTAKPVAAVPVAGVSKEAREDYEKKLAALREWDRAKNPGPERDRLKKEVDAARLALFRPTPAEIEKARNEVSKELRAAGFSESDIKSGKPDGKTLQQHTDDRLAALTKRRVANVEFFENTVGTTKDTNEKALLAQVFAQRVKSYSKSPLNTDGQKFATDYLIKNLNLGGTPKTDTPLQKAFNDDPEKRRDVRNFLTQQAGDLLVKSGHQGVKGVSAEERVKLVNRIAAGEGSKLTQQEKLAALEFMVSLGSAQASQTSTNKESDRNRVAFLADAVKDLVPKAEFVETTREKGQLAKDIGLIVALNRALAEAPPTQNGGVSKQNPANANPLVAPNTTQQNNPVQNANAAQNVKLAPSPTQAGVVADFNGQRQQLLAERDRLLPLARGSAGFFRQRQARAALQVIEGRLATVEATLNDLAKRGVPIIAANGAIVPAPKPVPVTQPAPLPAAKAPAGGTAQPTGPAITPGAHVEGGFEYLFNLFNDDNDNDTIHVTSASLGINEMSLPLSSNPNDGNLGAILVPKGSHTVTVEGDFYGEISPNDIRGTLRIRPGEADARVRSGGDQRFHLEFESVRPKTKQDLKVIGH